MILWTMNFMVPHFARIWCYIGQHMWRLGVFMRETSDFQSWWLGLKNSHSLRHRKRPGELRTHRRYLHRDGRLGLTKPDLEPVAGGKGGYNYWPPSVRPKPFLGKLKSTTTECCNLGYSPKTTTQTFTASEESVRACVRTLIAILPFNIQEPDALVASARQEEES